MDLMGKIIQERGLEKEMKKQEFIMDVTEAICRILEEDGISRQELADRLGKSKSLISQLLNGSRNMTLNTLAEICLALNCKPEITLTRQQPEVVSLSFPVTEKQPSCNYRIAV